MQQWGHILGAKCKQDLCVKLHHRYQTEGKKEDFILDAGVEKENLAVYLQYLEHETVAVVLIT